MVGTVDIPVDIPVERVESVQLSSPPMSGQLSLASPQTVALEDLGDSDAPVGPRWAGVLLPSTLDGFSGSVLGDPIAYAQCEQIPESNTPMTLPIYTLFIRYHLNSLMCRVSLRFRLCWLWRPPLVRRPACGHCSGGAI